MRTIFVYLFLITFLLTVESGLGQDLEIKDVLGDQNWLESVGSGSAPFFYSLKRYNIQNVLTARIKLELIQHSKSSSEWDGVYYSETGIGDGKLIWKSKIGYVEFYYYHELKTLDFGTANSSENFVEFYSKKIPKASRKILVPVKLATTHFLVPQDRLSDFIILSVGLNFDSADRYYYWRREKDMRNEVFGLPILPDKYKNMIRQPIEAKIVKVLSRRIVADERYADPENNHAVHYPVTINNGKNNGVKVGMDFLVKDVGEWIRISKVFKNKANGYVIRTFDQNGGEECWDGKHGSNQTIPCKPIQPEMNVKTKTDL